jgi:hypothetical protein
MRSKVIEQARKENIIENRSKVGEKPNIVFFHIPKCAGTSLLGYLGQHYNGQVLADIDIDTTLEKFADIHPEKGWAFVGHIDFNHYRQITVPHV